MNPEDSPRIIVGVPPLLYVIPFAAGAGAEFLLPAPFVPDRLQHVLGAALAAVAGLIMPFVLMEFRRARTSFDARKPSTRIISAGPYRFSRNPAYVSLTLLYLGGAIAIDSLWISGGLVAAVALTHCGVILPEERYLESKFGDEYRRYKNSVRRWL